MDGRKGSRPDPEAVSPRLKARWIMIKHNYTEGKGYGSMEHAYKGDQKGSSVGWEGLRTFVRNERRCPREENEEQKES